MPRSLLRVGAPPPFHSIGKNITINSQACGIAAGTYYFSVGEHTHFFENTPTDN
jgi:hypothetical protein